MDRTRILVKLSAKSVPYTYTSVLGYKMFPWGFIWSFLLSSLEEFVKQDKLGVHSKKWFLARRLLSDFIGLSQRFCPIVKFTLHSLTRFIIVNRYKTLVNHNAILIKIIKRLSEYCYWFCPNFWGASVPRVPPANNQNKLLHYFFTQVCNRIHYLKSIKIIRCPFPSLN